MAESDLADLLTWLEPQHLPFLNLFQPRKETCNDATKTTDQAGPESQPEGAAAS